jgi:hypothetical protein
MRWLHKAVLLLPALAGLLMAGCSQDKHVFKSTIHLPVNVEVYDTASDQVLWRKEVPVGLKLVLDFDRPLEFEPMWTNMQPATSMQWRLYRDDETKNLEERFKWKEAHVEHFPGTPIMLRVSYRPAPEYPAGYTPPDMSATETAAEGTPATAPAVSPATVEPVRPEPAPIVVPAEPGAEGTTVPAQPGEPAVPAVPGVPVVPETPAQPARDAAPAPTTQPELPTLD